MQDKFHLTPVEHELMQILWELGQGTVRDVMSLLPNDRQLAYTSVSTILRILQQKKIVSAEKVGKQHIYRPLLSHDKFATDSVDTIVKQLFSGNSVNLVTYLVDHNQLAADDIKMIQQLLESKKKELDNAK